MPYCWDEDPNLGQLSRIRDGTPLTYHLSLALQYLVRERNHKLKNRYLSSPWKKKRYLSSHFLNNLNWQQKKKKKIIMQKRFSASTEIRFYVTDELVLII